MKLHQKYSRTLLLLLLMAFGYGTSIIFEDHALSANSLEAQLSEEKSNTEEYRAAKKAAILKANNVIVIDPSMLPDMPVQPVNNNRATVYGSMTGYAA